MIRSPSNTFINVVSSGEFCCLKIIKGLRLFCIPRKPRVSGEILFPLSLFLRIEKALSRPIINNVTCAWVWCGRITTAFVTRCYFEDAYIRPNSSWVFSSASYSRMFLLGKNPQILIIIYLRLNISSIRSLFQLNPTACREGQRQHIQCCSILLHWQPVFQFVMFQTTTCLSQQNPFDARARLAKHGI